MTDSTHTPPDPNERREDRERMVRDQIARRGLVDERVLDAMHRIPRERFVPPRYAALAYADKALPVGPLQTISQPFMVAYMTAAIQVESHHTVLEVGTGTGYQAAILACLARRVHTIERDAGLSREAGRRLGQLGIENVELHVGDGSTGYRPASPYDRIIVTAAVPRVPDELVDQLTDGGILVAPVGGRAEQTLVRVRKQPHAITRTYLLAVRFVPLTGQSGFDFDSDER